MMLGDTTTAVTTTTAPATTPGFLTGLEAWKSPSAAFTALGTSLSNFTSAFSGANLPVALGLWAPPLILGAILIGSMGKKGR